MQERVGAHSIVKRWSDHLLGWGDRRRRHHTPVRGANRPADKADEIGAKGCKRRGQRILVREVELAEDQTGGGAMMKKSYHSIVVPIVEAMTALRRLALCSDADSVPYVAVVVIAVPPGCFLFPGGGLSAARLPKRG